MKKSHSRTLVLNADFTPIAIIPWWKAITLKYKNVITEVDFYHDDYIKCSGGKTHPIPAVIAIHKYVSTQARRIPFSRKNVFTRDLLTCQYCGERFEPDELTYDHVIPRSKHPNKHKCTTWENIVTCCHPCNHRKSDKLLADVNMGLIKRPMKPNPKLYILGLTPWSKVQKEWVPYLSPLYKTLLNIDENGEALLTEG